MRLIRKTALVSAVCLFSLNNIPSIYAAEQTVCYRTLTQYGFGRINKLNAQTECIYTEAPTLNVYKEIKDSETYLYISVNQVGTSVFVNGTTVGVDKEDLYNFRYHVTKSGWYEVRVAGNHGGSRSESIYVEVSDHSTSLDLSKESRNGEYYLIIKASDDDGIESVKVNDHAISFSEYSGEASYKIYNTGTYTVKVKDKKDHTQSKSIYINVNNDHLKLNLSKKYHSGKWHLLIEADSDVRINKVTVNGKVISFPSSGGKEEYEVAKSGTYKVVIRDQDGYTKTESLYIDVNSKVSQKPVVKVSQEYKVNNTAGWYLVIKATDDEGIATITVNGQNIPIDEEKGIAQYYVPVDGSYQITVTDNEGNTCTTTTFAAGNVGSDANMPSNLLNTGTQNSTIIFKLNSKKWTKDGVIQQEMNVPLIYLNSRVYLPIRYMAYALNINPENIQWNANNKIVTIYNGSQEIKTVVGSKTVYVNDVAVKIDSAPVIRKGCVMLPISQINKVFSDTGVRIDWNNNTKQLIITKNM